jgi:voltage-gated potassium channel
MSHRTPAEDAQLRDERWELLEHLDGLLDPPLVVLSLVWVALLVLSLTIGLPRPLDVATYVIWGLFVFDFVLEVTVAPDRMAYLRSHWLTALSLVVPALRVFRIVTALRALRAAEGLRSVSLVRIVGGLNRGMRALRSAFAGRRIAYVVALTTIVIFAGAAGMYYLERPSAGFGSYGEALWWTAMAVTTMGSADWPKTAEGRVLGWLIALYAFAVFGYITATIATWLIGAAPDAAAATDHEPGAAVAGADIAAELAALREEVRRLEAAVRADRGSGARRMAG